MEEWTGEQSHVERWVGRKELVERWVGRMKGVERHKGGWAAETRGEVEWMVRVGCGQVGGQAGIGAKKWPLEGSKGRVCVT